MDCFVPPLLKGPVPLSAQFTSPPPLHAPRSPHSCHLFYPGGRRKGAFCITPSFLSVYLNKMSMDVCGHVAVWAQSPGRKPPLTAVCTAALCQLPLLSKTPSLHREACKLLLGFLVSSYFPVSRNRILGRQLKDRISLTISTSGILLLACFILSDSIRLRGFCQKLWQNNSANLCSEFSGFWYFSD